jgi:nucleotide-binding universal stress UspA family protein
MTRRILVPVDFSPCSDAALDYALGVADESGAEVEVLHVWRVRERDGHGAGTIFADTPEGIAMEQRLSAADRDHAARVCGRLEFGDEPSSVILDILRREGFDLVVIGAEGEGSGAARLLAESAASDAGADSSADASDAGDRPSDGNIEAVSSESCGPVSGHVAACIAKTAPCKVVTTRPPPPPSSGKIVAA